MSTNYSVNLRLCGVFVEKLSATAADHSSIQLEMWANAQRDGRPVKYRWRPLFNAAKFG